MRTPNSLGGFAALLATIAAGACGSLDSGQINIVDALGGSSSGSGGASGGGGTKSSTGGAPVNGGDAGAGAVSDTGGQAGAGGEGGVTLGGSAGAPVGGVGGTGGTGGTGGDAGAGAGAGGEAGGSPGGCSKGSDCLGTTPICDPTQLLCRACTSAAECASDDARTPFCRAGSCVGCITDTDCPVATPVCGAGNTCRVCSAGSECASLACNANGRCATTAQVVYALAQTGVYANDCGAIERPCGSLTTAASKLTATRPTLVLVATQSIFQEGATLPANLNVTVVGNHVRVAPYDGASAFIVSGGSVVFDEVVVATTTPSSGAQSAAIACTGGAKLKFFKGSVSNANTNYGSAGLQLSPCDGDVQQATFTGSVTGIASSCPNCATPTQTLTVERSLFQGNRNAIGFTGATFLIRNNLFLRNGNTSYVDIIGIRATSGVLSFNTMVGNENNCSYEGGLVSCEGGAAACGTFSSNLSWSNMLNPTQTPPSPCPDQVYYNPPPLSNSLAETTWPGTGNVSADPKFLDPSKDNYTPGPGSPALNKGSTSTVAGIVPALDYYGNPRGSAPDIGAIEAQ